MLFKRPQFFMAFFAPAEWSGLNTILSMLSNYSALKSGRDTHSWKRAQGINFRPIYVSKYLKLSGSFDANVKVSSINFQ